MPDHPRKGRNFFERFTTSGLFFMLIGGCLLYAAYETMGIAHPSLSFVMVVSGVAILLYGTGTQGVGEVDSHGYKVAIAGGAGVLALCIGWGIVSRSTDIKTAFQMQKQYIQVFIKPTQDGISPNLFSRYMTVVSLEGEEIPVARHGNISVAYVGYFMSDKYTPSLEITLYPDPTKPSTDSTLATPSDTIPFLLDLGRNTKQVDYSSFIDFPRYKISAVVGLKAPKADRSQTQDVDANQVDVNQRVVPGGAEPPRVPILSGEQH